MKFMNLLSVMTMVMSSQHSLATISDQDGNNGFKKVYVFNVDHPIREVCSVDEDGTLVLSFDCRPDFLTRLMTSGEIIKRKSNEVTEIITPLYSEWSSKILVMIDHTLFTLRYSRADGRSAITVIQSSPESLQKYKYHSTWTVQTNTLATATAEQGQYKVGDRFCLNDDGKEVPVIINTLFSKSDELLVRSQKEYKGEFLGENIPLGSFSRKIVKLSDLSECSGSAQE